MDSLEIKNKIGDLDIAVIGMCGRFPKARNLDVFWQNLRDGIESISFFSNQELESFGVDPSLLSNPNYVKANAVLEDIELFDASFFDYSPKIAEIMDPQHRLFLETAWEALENAGYDSKTYEGRISTYGSTSISSYFLFNLFSNTELVKLVGLDQIRHNNRTDNLTTRVAYKLDLKGSAITVQTGCSSSLVAVHLACQSLIDRECDMALAGGVSVTALQKTGYFYQEGGILSPDGHCRAFDAQAKGTVGGDGVGIVILKRLADALADGDYIHAVIKGSAINNDGSSKVGYTAPSIDGQAKVIAEALAIARIKSEMVSYVEAHGTGTVLGDPIEIAALTKSFRARTEKKNFCAIGSVKTNIGHLDTASGVAGLIKTILALKHKQIPPSLHFEQPNSEIDFANSPFYVNTTLSDWKTNGTPRCAGVSSFGIGGTNAHVILEEAPIVEPSGPARPWQLLLLSAKTSTALEIATANLATHLKQHPDLNLADVAYTLDVGRRDFDHRRMLVCQDLEDAVKALSPLDPQQVFTHYQKPCNLSVVFMFPGQGAQYVEMGRELYQSEPIFREQVDQCCELLKLHLGVDLRSVLYPSKELLQDATQQLKQTHITQPALFVIEYSLAQLWIAWGVRPSAMIGHSIGEYVAACLAGVFSLEDALALVVARGQLMQQMPAGDMLAVPLPEKEVRSMLGEEVALAAINAPSLCVLSGLRLPIDELHNRLTKQGIDCRRLHTSGAFHSQMMDPIIEPFMAQVQKINLKAPQIPFVSNVTGTWMTKTEATDPSYWARHLRQTVRFAEGVALLLQTPEQILLEIGPGRTLSTLAGKQKEAQQLVLSSLRHPQEQQSDVVLLLNTLGKLWLNGIQVDWSGFYANEQRYRIPLPTYPFDRKKYWIESSKVNTYHPLPKKEISVSEPKDVVSNSLQYDKILSILKGILSNFSGLSSSEIDIHAHFIEIGVDSLMFTQMSRAIQEQLGLRISFRVLLEELPTIHDLGIYITQNLPPEEPVAAYSPQESMTTVTPQALTEEPLSIQPPVSQALNPKNERPVAGTAMEQLMAQQLQIMSKLVDLLDEGGLSRKSLPSSEAIPSSPLHQGEQVAQTSTNTFVLNATQSTDLASKLTKSTNIIESEQQFGSRELTSRQFVPSQQFEKKSMAGLNSRQQKYLDAFMTRFIKRTQESKRLTQAYRSCHANSRAITGFLGATKEMVYPIHAQRGEGARLWDVDGNEYVDISMGFGALLFGHSPSFVMEALQEHIKQGIQHGPQSRLAGQVAELICEMTGAERAAFCTTGTEAVMAAIRLARAATGRSKIALFAGSYHGSFDGVLVKGLTTSDGTLRSVPKTLGVPSYMAEDVMVLDYGSPKSLNTLKAHAHELAAILVEPVQSNQIDFHPKEFLSELRQLTKETGTVLIFDEVISGFRVHPGGIQKLWDIQADITTYGKAIGAGLPIGVVAGKAAFIDAIDGGFWNYGDASYPDADTTFFAGTFFKHPLVMTATWAALNHIKNRGPKLQEELTQRTTKLAKNLNSYFEQKQTPIRVVNFGSQFQFNFQNKLKFNNLFFYHLLEKGVYVWEGNNRFLSTAHTDEDIEQVIRSVKESVVEMQEGGFFPPSEISINEKELIKVPLVEAQKELWFLAQIGDETSRAYNESRTIQLRGPFNLLAVRQAVEEIINRHEVLRTTFSPEGDYQLIHSTLSIDIPFSDFSTLNKSQREVQLSEFLTREAQQTFDLEQGPLLRFHIVKLEEQHYLLIWTNHHIVADGWSMSILQQELAAIYSAESQGITCQLPQPMKWSEYALWQAQMQQSAEMVKAETYWLDKFAASVPVLELPSDHPRPPIFTHAGARESIIISSSVYNALKSLSTRCRCTLFTILLAGFMALLQRLTAQKDIVVGIASAGQSLIASEHLVGHCVNLLPIRSQVMGDLAFTEYMSSVKQVLLDAYEHQIYPLIRLVENLNLPRDISRTPLFTTFFNLDKVESRLESFEHKFGSAKNSTYSTKYDLSFNLNETSSELLVECDYNTDIFDSQTIQRWMEHFRTLLEGIVANPNQRLSGLPLLTETQQHQLLVDWNNTQVDYPQEQCIHKLFEAQVERSPDTIAVVFEDQQLTYRELNQRANQLAHHMRSLGVGPEVLVGICVERSLSMVIGLLGILKAGGAYVPLDPTYPQERLAFILEDAQVPVLLTQGRLGDGMPQHKAKVVCLDADWQAIAEQSKENSLTQVTANNLAYVIYTSGSTGKPKGVQIPHSALSNFLHAMRQTPELTELDTLLAVTTISFDIAALELFLPITVGARLVLVSLEIAWDGTQLSAKLTDSNATVMQATPATWQLLLAAGWGGNHQLKILCGGEALPRHLANELLNRCDSLWNMYGPTETTIWSAACLVETDSNIVPISQAIANTQFYILDQHAQLVPIGVPGELYIGGDGLARGYLKRPELTAEKFIPNPFEESKVSRLYKTGDLARYLPNGEIEYLGRIDHQVKVRGFRIELGEIEARLSQHSKVRETVVVVRSDQTDFQRIVAYVVPQSEQTLTMTELRDFLESKLPNYMVPVALVMLEALPLTPNGKVDRKALPAPDTARPQLEAVYQPPETEVEKAIANIWEESLHVEDVGIHDNFFELGGHSLLLVQVHSKLQKIFQRDFPLVEMFQYPTISRLATYLGQESSEQQSFTQHSHRPESRTTSVQRRKQARKEHRAAQKGVSSQ